KLEDAPPEKRVEQRLADDIHPFNLDSGRMWAFAVYLLYLLSIPSLAIFALIGVIVAYIGLKRADALARHHLDDHIPIWWIAFLWGVALLLPLLVGAGLAAIGIGVPVLVATWAIGFLVMLWFTVKSAFGLIALLEGRERAAWRFSVTNRTSV